MLPNEYQALKLIKPRMFSLETIEIDKNQENRILAEVKGCAICGTDLKIYRGERKVPSAVLGHEFIAEIVEVGKMSKSFRIGQLITVATTISCGQCWYCLKGMTNLCERAIRLGIDIPGAFAKFISIPALAVQRGNVLPVPEIFDNKLGVLIEPLSCVLNGQQIAGMRPGLDMLVVGAGPMGLLHVLAARYSGARRIILSEVIPNRLKNGKGFKADVLVNPLEEDLFKCVENETDGRGVDLAIVCSPTVKAIQGLTSILDKKGTLSLFAGLSSEDKGFLLDGRAVHYRELTITGASDSRPEHFALAMRILEAHAESFRPLITHTFGLEQAKEAFEVLEKGEGLKVVFVPEGKR